MSLSGEDWKRHQQRRSVWEPVSFPTVELGTCGSGGKDVAKQSSFFIQFDTMRREVVEAVLSWVNMILAA